MKKLLATSAIAVVAMGGAAHADLFSGSGSTASTGTVGTGSGFTQGASVAITNTNGALTSGAASATNTTMTFSVTADSEMPAAAAFGANADGNADVDFTFDSDVDTSASTIGIGSVLALGQTVGSIDAASSGDASGNYSGERAAAGPLLVQYGSDVDTDASIDGSGGSNAGVSLAGTDSTFLASVGSATGSDITIDATGNVDTAGGNLIAPAASNAFTNTTAFDNVALSASAIGAGSVATEASNSSLFGGGFGGVGTSSIACNDSGGTICGGFFFP